MFEGTADQKNKSLWKILPFVILATLGLAAVLFYGGDSEPEIDQVEGVLHPGDDDFEWYVSHLQFEDRGIKMAKNFAGSRMVIFAGSIENLGDRTLDVLEVRLKLFNANEQIFETTTTPIKPGRYTPPLAPREMRGFTVYLEEWPRNWLASRAEMELYGFRFVQGDE